MTDEFRKPELSDRLHHVLGRNDIDTEHVELHEREIGNGPQYAIRVYHPNGTSIAWESPWYTEDQFRTYLRGIGAADELTFQTENLDN